MYHLLRRQLPCCWVFWCREGCSNVYLTYYSAQLFDDQSQPRFPSVVAGMNATLGPFLIRVLDREDGNDAVFWYPYLLSFLDSRPPLPLSWLAIAIAMLLYCPRLHPWLPRRSLPASDWTTPALLHVHGHILSGGLTAATSQ